MTTLSTAARLDLCAQIGTIQRETIALESEFDMLACELATLTIGADSRAIVKRKESIEQQIEEHYDAINAILEQMES